MKPAWMCLPPAVLSAFLGLLATPHAARAASTEFAVQADHISLRRPDASQFMGGSPWTPGSLDPASRPAMTSDSIRVGPGSDEPTTIVPASDPDVDRALSAAVTVAECVLCVAGAVALFVMLPRMLDFLHSETPVATGAGR